MKSTRKTIEYLYSFEQLQRRIQAEIRLSLTSTILIGMHLFLACIKHLHF